MWTLVIFIEVRNFNSSSSTALSSIGSTMVPGFTSKKNAVDAGNVAAMELRNERTICSFTTFEVK